MNEDKLFRIPMKMLLGEGPAWQGDPAFIRAYVAVEERTLVSPYRCHFLWQFARRANALPGSAAQLGVYRGGSAQLIASALGTEKPFYLFDTFAGLPEHDPEIDRYPKGKFSDTSAEEVRALFADRPNVRILPGHFPETAAAVPSEERFAFVYLDADHYRSTRDGLEFFHDRMVPGGAIVLDDFGFENCPGVKRAVDDFLSSRGSKELPIVTTAYQAVLLKATPPAARCSPARATARAS